MLDYVFLEAHDNDRLSGIAALYREMGWWDRAGGDDAAHVAALVAGSHAFLAVYEDGALAGMGRALSDRTSDAYVQDLAVRPPFRGRGIGGELAKRLVARLRADGISWIGLVAESGSRGMYERLGFEEMPGALPMLKKA
ncbi:MAG: GNAT family N-acetyltransferase [Deltaproteobacteria bacterium]|nr:GNAT family N-acetyltransferase [Deltaproteobacteria bacterium]